MIHATRVNTGKISILIVLFLATATAARPADRSLTLVCDRDYPPLSFLEGGILRGFDPDLAQALAPLLGAEITVQSAPWAAALEDTASGKADILSGVIKTSGRESRLAFSIPYLEDNYVIFRRSDLAVKQLPDLQKARLIMLEGDAAIETWVVPNGLSDNMSTCSGFTEAFEALENGDADYTVSPRALGLDLVAQRNYQSIKIWGRPLFSSSFALAVKSENQALLARLNDAIIALSRNGTLARLEERWKTGVNITSYDTQRVPSWLPLVLVSVLSGAGILLFLIITLRRSLAEHKRRTSADRDILSAILDTGSDAIWWFDEEANMLGANARAIAAPPALQEEAIARARRLCTQCGDTLVPPATPDETDDDAPEAVRLEAGPTLHAPIIAVRRNMSRELYALKTSERELSTELALCHARLREITRYDPATGLLRRGALVDLLCDYADIARRRADTLKIAFIRVKDLRRLNSRYSHTAVDRMLERIASGIRSLLEENECAGTIHTAFYVLSAAQNNFEDRENLIPALEKLVREAGIPEDHPVDIAAIETSANTAEDILAALEGRG